MINSNDFTIINKSIYYLNKPIGYVDDIKYIIDIFPFEICIMWPYKNPHEQISKYINTQIEEYVLLNINSHVLDAKSIFEEKKSNKQSDLYYENKYVFTITKGVCNDLLEEVYISREGTPLMNVKNASMKKMCKEKLERLITIKNYFN
jgi:hypothetical protein